MAEDLLIRLNSAAIARLRSLMDYYGETKPEGMISRALGLLEMLEPLVGPNGELTVLNANNEHDGDEEKVGLIFEKRKGRDHDPAVAA